jgi:fatty-acid desaturase
MYPLRLSSFWSNLLYLIGVGSLVFYITQGVSLWLLIFPLITHVALVSIFSAVVHRYYSHRSFSANESLMFVLSCITSAYGYATPSHWAVLHSAHHAFTDTDKDPHIKGFRGVFTATYKTPPYKQLLAKKWFHSKKHTILLNYSVSLVLIWNLLLSLISIDLMLIIGLIPLATTAFANGLHRSLSHSPDDIRNLWFLEYLIPMGGEWIHHNHHKNPKVAFYSRNKKELDTGGWLIKLLIYKQDNGEKNGELESHRVWETIG